MNHGRSITITEDSPYAGWDFHISHIEHDIDRMDDLYTLALWSPEATDLAHQFDTYRYGYGWTVLNAALTAADEQADARMQAALDWWTEHHTSPPYQIHRILVAIHDTTWASRDEIAQRLNLTPTDLAPDTATADALDAAARHGLITWRHPRGQHPKAALTPDGYDLIHPDDRAAGHTAQRRLQALTIQPVDPHAAPPTAGRAFAPNNQVHNQSSPAGAHPPAVAAAPRRTRTAR